MPMDDQFADSDRRTKPTRAERLDRLARRGDVEGVWRLIQDSLSLERDQRDGVTSLLRAIEVAARRDPDQLVDWLFGRMIAVAAILMCRTQLQGLALLEQGDEDRRGDVQNGLPRRVREDVLPALAGLQRDLADILQARAHTARVLEIAREKRLRNDVLEADALPGAGHRPARQRGRRKAAPCRRCQTGCDHPSVDAYAGASDGSFDCAGGGAAQSVGPLG